MNTLSWLIYLADVADGIGGAISVFAFVCLALTVGALIGFLSNHDCGDEDEVRACRSFGIKSGIVAFVCAILASLIPSQSTVYAIAASEMGETALKSETGGKAIQALNAWLDRQIEGEPKE